MLVEQVLSRSMGVWILAVALLVGVVFCVTQDELDLTDRMVKKSSMSFLEYRLKLKAAKICIKQTGFTLDWFITSMKYKVEQGRELLVSIEPVMQLRLYHLSEVKYVEMNLPNPVGPNSMIAARVQEFGKGLVKVLNKLQEFLERWDNRDQQYLAAQEHDKFIAHVFKLFTDVNFPFISDTNRFADLRKTTIEVSWQEVRELHDGMHQKLSPYVPTEPLEALKRMTGAVVEHFLKLQNGEIDTAILNVLEDLYRNHRVYRLAACEAYIIYVKGYPDAFHVTQQMDNAVRSLNNFANALSTIMRDTNFSKKFSKLASSQAISLRLKSMGGTVKMWNCNIVHYIREALVLKLDNFAPLSTLYDVSTSRMSQAHVANIVSFSKVIGEVEEMLRFSLTYKYVRTVIANPMFKERNLTDIKYLVANMDEKFIHLSNFLSSAEVESVCAEWETYFLYVSGELGKKMWLLCKLSQNANSLLDVAMGDTSHYSIFLSLFPTGCYPHVEAIVGGNGLKLIIRHMLAIWHTEWHAALYKFLGV